MITVSIVSHNHGKLIPPLVHKLINYPEVSKIVLTINIPECIDLPSSTKILIIQNLCPLGFGMNHNNAFKECDTRFYCVLNPDVEFITNPFGDLLSKFETDVGIVSPRAVGYLGQLSDNIRKYPTLYNIFLKLIRFDFTVDKTSCGSVKNRWVSGMFMLIESSLYNRISGFDTSYYMYYEDVDLCKRIINEGKTIYIACRVYVIHEGARQSHNSYVHFKWHLKSMIRFFCKRLFGTL